ncbi:MAG TPA: serine--tRNA ligase, partial [Methanothrix sp.]|nr:serine--tRNA ligase [Methanothrix sp.]
MKFHLEASLRLSADAEKAEAALSDFFGNAGQLLQKGAPEGQGAKISSWKLSGSKIDLVIDSDRYVRAHDALLRLRRPLSELLGKQFRIGVRGMEIGRFDIEVESERGIEHKIPYVREIKFDGKKLFIALDVGPQGSLGQSEIENRIPDRIISLLEEKLQSGYGGKTEHWELLWESAPREPKFNRDPTEEMQKAGWIKHGASRGQWIYGPQATHVFRTFEKIVLEEIISPLGYREMIFPKLDTWDVWKKSG